jgi:hypothetical protein
MRLRKRIWLYWHSGPDNAPEFVKTCIDSWIVLNPEWDVIVISNGNVDDYVDMEDIRKSNSKLPIQAFADALRWRLIARHGGVWADATLYCNRPLDAWLPSSMGSEETFLFRAPGQPFLFHSWFLAVGSEHLKCRMEREIHRYLVELSGHDNYMNSRGIWRLYKALEPRLNSVNHQFWRSRFVAQFLRVRPYFFQNYLLGWLVQTDPAIRRVFHSIPNLYGEKPHSLQVASETGRLDEAFLRDFVASDVPVIKLTWKRYGDLWQESGVFAFLEETLRRRAESGGPRAPAVTSTSPLP